MINHLLFALIKNFSSHYLLLIMKNKTINQSKIDVLSQVVLFLTLASVGVKWIPLAKIGGITLEVSNVMQLILIFVFFPIYLKRSNFKFRMSFFMNFLLGFISLIALIVVCRSHSEASGILRLSVFSVMSSYVLVNIDARALLYSRLVVPLALGSFILVILISFHLADKSFVTSVFSYFKTFDRNEFLYGNFRPALNVFSGSSEIGKPVYLASNVNPISSVFALLFIISGALSFQYGWPMLFAALVSLFFVLLLFSLSAVLICAFCSLVFVLKYSRNIKLTFFKSIILFVFVFILVVISGPLISFGYSAIMDNGVSIGHRVLQYSLSIELINESPLWGPGYILIDGLQIHNLIIFSWISGGVLMFFGAVFIYLMLLYIMFEGIYISLFKDSPYIEHLLMATLPVVFLVRCSVGGAGGLPVGTASVAVALAILARKNIQSNLR